MKFADPYWLPIGLAACGLLAWLFHRHDRRQRAALAAFASRHLLEKLTASISPARRTVKRFLLLFGLACLFVALARPQAGYLWQETQQRSVDILFAVDTSKSMLTQDVKPDRLTRARMAVDDLADRLDGDRLGLVAFAGEAFLECPLTLDGDAFRQSVDALDTTTIPRGGTDISSAIREAQEAFRAEPGSTKLLILMTDGEDLEGSAVDAAKEAAKDGLKIDTIGIGTPEGDLIPVPNDAGGTDFVHDAGGQIVKSRLDESRLREIAQATGGTYRPLGQRGEGMTQLYEEELASLSHDQEATRKVRVPLERFQWPLALGLLALLLEPLIGTRRSRGGPRAAVVSEPPRKRWLPRSRQGGLTTPPAATLLLCFSLAAVGTLRASPEAGEEAFQKGDYAKAEQEFEKAAQKAKTPPPELQLDLGSAAYKNNQYDKAGEAYQKTLQTDQLNVQQQAYYNLGDTLYRLGQQTEKGDSKQTVQAWQQAIQSYENALKLKPDDADAKFNRDFVKRKLDELQKKPPQNQGGQSDKNDQNKDQQQQQNQNQSQNSQNSQDNSKSNPSQNQNQSQSQQNQNQNPSQQPNPSPGNPQQNQNQNQNPAGQSGQNPQQQQQQPQPQGENGQNQNQPPSQPQSPPPNGQNPSPSQTGNPSQPQQQPSNQGQPQSAQAEPGQMTPEEAKNLLNSVRGDEKILPQSQKGGGAEQPPEKDW